MGREFKPTGKMIEEIEIFFVCDRCGAKASYSDTNDAAINSWGHLSGGGDFFSTNLDLCPHCFSLAFAAVC